MTIQADPLPGCARGVVAMLSVSRTKVDYAIEKAGIRERSRAGILRFFSVDQLPVIRAALETVVPRVRRCDRLVDGGQRVEGDHD